ncbi:UDP-glucuronosyltransferase 3A1 isoform X1 [Callithrix jacchus]
MSMAGHRVLLLVGFLLPRVLLSEAAKILTISTLGGSHYLLLDRVSQILLEHGHNVTMLLLSGKHLASDTKDKEKSYQVIRWFPPEDYQKTVKERFNNYIEKALDGREETEGLVKVMEIFGTQCSYLLSRKDIMDSLNNENVDLVFVEGFDFCSFLIAEKLEKPFVAILPASFGSLEFGLPSPLSYVPVFYSLLTDRMDFWGRVKNVFMFFRFSTMQRCLHSTFDNTIKEHFTEGSRPVLSHLLRKAELWFVNSDFAFDFARPLLPNTVYVGGLMEKPIKPVPQDLENFIANFGDAGFVLVAFGSTLDIYESQEVLKNMHSAFAQLPQGVIWKCQSSRWPKDVHLATNVKIMDWLPQSDLLAHPSIRLFVTHGGQNSIMEAIRHGVPMVGLPVNGDQHGNMVRVVAKNYGVVMQLNQVTADTLALKMKQVIEDKRYKSAVVAGSVILHSQPLSAQQRLVGWIDHILQTKGAAHLKPYAFQQPWHEQYLIDVFVFLLMLTLGTVWLCGKLLEPGIVSGTNTAGTTGYYLEKRQYLIETSHHIQN